MKIIYSDEDSFEFFDLYHGLADEVQVGIAELLGRVLDENKIDDAAQREKIVSSFLFRLMSAFDSWSPVTLDSPTVALFDSSKISESEDLAKEKWYPALCFLKRGQNGSERVADAIETVLISANTALHETALENAKKIANGGETKQN